MSPFARFARSPAMNDPRQWRMGLFGYGEVGRILAEDLR